MFENLMHNKAVLWGGAGVVALIGAWLIFHKGGSSGNGAIGYVPPTVIGTGGTSTDASGASTDNSISQIIAANLQLAADQSNAVIHQSDNQKAVAMATLDANKTVALNDNQTTQNVALTSQLGNVINAFTSKVTSSVGGTSGFFGIGATAGSSQSSEIGPSSINGELGFDQNGMLKINLAGAH
jgi:hypothetical protein